MSFLGRLSCKFDRHLQPVEPIWNAGWAFGICPRCGHEVCTPSGEGNWQRIPHGMKVVWKPMTVEEREFRNALDVLHYGSNDPPAEV